MLYFAYGSNLDPEARQRVPGCHVVGLAALRDYQLTFPRYSHTWGGGVSSVQPHHGASVWGIVFAVSESELQDLDRSEEFRGPGDQHNVYDRQVVLVELTRPDDGSVPRRLSVYTYVARPSNPSAPSPEYREAMLRGAEHHRLPEEYRAWLRSIPVAEPRTEA